MTRDLGLPTSLRRPRHEAPRPVASHSAGRVLAELRLRVVDRVIDLDAAAQAIEARRDRWTRAGLSVGPVTWRDEAEKWPQKLKTDRTKVADPDSVGVTFNRDTWRPGDITLFRGGWADVNLVDAADEMIVEYAPVPDVQTFGDVLDHLVERLLRQAP